MTQYTIEYGKKNTNSSNIYYNIDYKDKLWLFAKMFEVQSYMNELSLSKDISHKEVTKWYTSPDKVLPYSKTFSRNNSPSSFVAGLINNMVFGSQNDISETQAKYLQYIINSYTDLSSELNLKLQKNVLQEPVNFQQNVFVIK